MKKLSLILIGLLLIPTLFLTSCDRGDDVVVNSTPAFTLLKNHMLANNFDIDKILMSPDGVNFVQGAPAEADLPAFLAKYYIVDIRSAADFAAKHITGAKNVPFANILAEGALAGTKPILMVCYTGQTASYGAALLRMYGFRNTQALKWGMSGWNSTTAGPWNGKIGAEEAKGHANWSYDAAPTNSVYTDPAFLSLASDGAAILKSRVEAVVAEGFKTVTGTEVLNNPANYFVHNYFSAADYAAFGHIKNAYRISPLLLADNSYLNLDPNANTKIVNYCYTGQTSAVVTACLRVMGYNAHSLMFGMNGLYNTNTAWTSNKWGVAPNVPKNLPFATN